MHAPRLIMNSGQWILAQFEPVQQWAGTTAAREAGSLIRDA
jgi:hypothetical protein